MSRSPDDEDLLQVHTHTVALTDTLAQSYSHIYRHTLELTHYPSLCTKPVRPDTLTVTISLSPS